MRTFAGLAEAALAAVLAAAGVLLGLHVTSQPASILPGGQETITLTAAGATYLSPTQLTEVRNARLVVTDTIRERTQPGYPLIAVWSVVSSAYDPARHQLLEPTAGTYAFDRTTAELVNCCNTNINGNSGIQQSGIAGWLFPRGTRPRTYEVFDSTLNDTQPFKFAGTDTVGGILTYRFTENAAAALFSISAVAPTDAERYIMHRTYWVDPQTGALLQISEAEDLYLVNPATGATVTHLLDAHLITTPQTVASLVSQDNRARSAGPAAEHKRLAFYGIAGLLAVLAVLLFLRATATRRRPAPGGYR